MLFIGQTLWLNVDHKKKLCEVLFNVYGSLESDVQQLLMGFSPPPRPLFLCSVTPCCVFLLTYHPNQGPFYINKCPHPDQTMLRLSCPVCTTLATCHWKEGEFIFPPTRLISLAPVAQPEGRPQPSGGSSHSSLTAVMNDAVRLRQLALCVTWVCTCVLSLYCLLE